MPLDLTETYVRLSPHGPASPLHGGAAFWAQSPAELNALGGDWLVSEHVCATDWASWEMHPAGDEIVYLLAGAVDLVLERAGGHEVIALRGRGAVIVPQGVWHTAKAHAPSRVLHVTRGRGTQNRPV